MTSPVKYFKLMNDSTKVMKDFRIISDEVLHVEWENSPGFEQESLVTSEIHASLVTSYAR